jgi:hypothetical protein
VEVSSRQKERGRQSFGIEERRRVRQIVEIPIVERQGDRTFGKVVKRCREELLERKNGRIGGEPAKLRDEVVARHVERMDVVLVVDYGGTGGRRLASGPRAVDGLRCA